MGLLQRGPGDIVKVGGVPVVLSALVVVCLLQGQGQIWGPLWCCSDCGCLSREVFAGGKKFQRFARRIFADLTAIFTCGLFLLAFLSACFCLVFLLVFCELTTFLRL